MFIYNYHFSSAACHIVLLVVKVKKMVRNHDRDGGALWFDLWLGQRVILDHPLARLSRGSFHLPVRRRIYRAI